MKPVPNIVKLAFNNNEIVCCEDGFYRYWPNESRSLGAMNSYDLRQLADYLDEVNEPWQKTLNDYFNKAHNEEGENSD